MRKITARNFTANTAWGALDVAAVADATVRLLWTDAPYVWHVNDGPEVFVPLDGSVVMRSGTGGVSARCRSHPATSSTSSRATSRSPEARGWRRQRTHVATEMGLPMQTHENIFGASA